MNMNESKFTPGPWVQMNRLDELGNPCGINIGGEHYVICRLPDGATITGGYAWPEQLANARLIAAAPDLLAACEKVLQSLEWNVAKEYLPETRQCLIAALAKARGEGGDRMMSLSRINTEVISNGSKWAGEEPDSIQDLIEVLAREPLDPRFEEYGCFICSLDDEQNLGCPKGTVGFFGNFFAVSHGFDIHTNDREIIESLTKAIRGNMATPEYQAARRERMRG